MSRSNRVERPAEHPFGLSPEQATLYRISALHARRDAAVNEARALGPVRVPLHWLASVGQYLPQGNAFTATRYLQLAREEQPSSAVADALAAGSWRFADVRVGGVNGAKVDLDLRSAAFDRAVWRDRSRGVVPHSTAVTGLEAIAGAPLAVVTATSTFERDRRTTTHVARVGAAVGQGFHDTEAAYAEAVRLLASGAETTPLALLTSPGGRARITRIQLPEALASAAHADALVASVAGTGTRLAWSASTTTLAAVVGLDGVAWL